MIVVPYQGRLYEVEQVPIESLPAWHAAHPNLVPVGSATLPAGEWRVVLYEPAE